MNISLQDINKIIFDIIGYNIEENTIKQLLFCSKQKNVNKGDIIIYSDELNSSKENDNSIYMIISGLARSFYLNKNGQNVTHKFFF